MHRYQILRQPSQRALACAMLAVLQSGCGSRDPVRFAVVLDRDGVQGAELAAADVNSAGGIGGRKLELMILTGTSSTTARVALEVADSLARDAGIVAVVGHTNSSASLAAAQIYNSRGLPQIAPTSSAPYYGEAGPYSFRMIASDTHQGVYLAEWASRLGCARPAVLYVNDDYGRGLQGSVARTLATRGGPVVYHAPFGEGAELGNARELATAVTRARPDLVIWLGRAPELKQALPELRKLTPRLRIIASDGVGGPHAFDSTNHGMPGVEFVRFMDWQRATPALRQLQSRYSQKVNAELTDQAVLSYDAVMLLAQAPREAGPDREQIRGYLERVGRGAPEFHGVSGPVRFDEKGDRAPMYSIHSISGRSPADCDAASQ